MGRPRLATKVNMGGRFEAALATKFLDLARIHGVSMREALRRLMVQAILEGHIPGIDTLELEQREKAKWGEAVPTYEGEPPPQKKSTGRIAPALPGETIET